MIKKLSPMVAMLSEADPSFDLFESRYPIPEGMTYNTYVVCDDKVAVLDTADVKVSSQWMADLMEVLGGRRPDYLVVHHMEPDHSANVLALIRRFPEMEVVASKAAVKMMGQFFGEGAVPLTREIGEGDVLDLGRHRLEFFAAPQVHWPEVMMSYEPSEGLLFSADAFGRFGPADPSYDWAGGARRYYFNICGKFGPQVRTALDKASRFDIGKICPLHGPVLERGLDKYLALYRKWSSYEPESDGVAVIYASFWGNTQHAAEYAAGRLVEAGREVCAVNLVRSDVSYAVEAAFRYGSVLLAAPTYEAGLAPRMDGFLRELLAKKFQKRRVGIIENGSWAPAAGKIMRGLLESAREVEVVGTVTLMSSMTRENKAQISEMIGKLRPPAETADAGRKR